MPQEAGASSYAFVAIITFVTWIALIFSPGIPMGDFLQELIMAVIVSLTVAALTYKHLPNASLKYFHPKRLGYLFVYVLVFIRELIKANLNMARIVLSPNLPIKPGIVKIKTDLKSDFARLLLGNSITLTPGTMTMEVNGDTLYIHWVEICDDLKEAGDIIKGSFEKWLKGVFS